MNHPKPKSLPFSGRLLFQLFVFVVFVLNSIKAQDSILQVSEAWMQAMTDNDIEALNDYMTEDYYLLLAGSRQGRIPRLEWQTNVKYYTHLGYEDAEVIDLDSVQVVSYREKFRVIGDVWYVPTLTTSAPIVDVWVRAGQRWKVKRRIVGDWAFFKWWQRLIGFGAGVGAVLLVSLLRRWIRRGKKPGKEAGQGGDARP